MRCAFDRPATSPRGIPDLQHENRPRKHPRRARRRTSIEHRRAKAYFPDERNRIIANVRPGWKRMMILRVLGVWLLLAAMVALTVDGTKSLASGEGQWVVTPLGKQWFDLHAASLNTLQAAVERHIVPWLWDPVILSLLQVPTWVFFGALGFALYWVGRRRRHTKVFDN
jgi:hypothetical protein